MVCDYPFLLLVLLCYCTAIVLLLYCIILAIVLFCYLYFSLLSSPSLPATDRECNFLFLIFLK